MRTVPPDSGSAAPPEGRPASRPALVKPGAPADVPDAPELKEACGVFGVYAPDRPVAQLTFYGLYALQHRGQESAGMAVSDGEAITVVKDMGLVTNVFDDRTLVPLQGNLAIGHVRYSTTGASNWGNAQPIFRPGRGGGLALGHNGNLVNTAAVASTAGILPGTLGSDSELIAQLLHAEIVASGNSLEAALGEVLPKLEGAYSLVLMDEQHLIGVRDPNGFRPLCLGRLDGGWVLASETTALDIVNARFVRELQPGEVVVIDAAGVRSLHPFPPDDRHSRLCLFEFVYFARPDSQLYGQTIHSARQRMGELLAEQAPLPKDTAATPRPAMVMPVPESGIPAAEGYARRSGITFGHGLVKNRYIGRTFISPSQDKRAQGVRVKLNPIRENIAGKRLVVVDDSIVRGTTQQALVAMLREAGAAEVHLRISSPPYRWPCFFGMDTGTQAELLAADLTVSEVRDYIGCDTLAYLDLDRLLAATGAASSGFCSACLTGEYPVPVPLRAGRSTTSSSASAEAVAEAPSPVTAETLPGVDLVHPCG